MTSISGEWPVFLVNTVHLPEIPVIKNKNWTLTRNTGHLPEILVIYQKN
jgi:hypothetical protein